MPPNRDYYMGVDIASGSPAGRRVLYSIVVIDSEGNTILVNPSASLSRLIRLAWEYRPRRLGLDNPMELASNKKELERVLSLLPPELEVVQVNAGEEGVQRIATIARERGLAKGRGKLDPVSTAYAAAFLAMEGRGRPIRVVEEKTLITVSKARSPKGGGYSQQRLQRRVRASVHIAAMKVKEALDKAGLEYDMNYRKSIGGLESAVFTVYASRDKLRGIVRPHRGLDYSITVKPVYRIRLNLEEEAGQPDTPLIVGLDPGITTGVAVLDINGRVVYLDSRKNLDRGEIVRILAGLGKPIIFAVDVAEIPESVRWIAAKFGAQVYSPGQDMESGEKRELATRILGRAPEDTHQRDALAAAYKAFLIVKNKLETIQRQLDRMGIGLDSMRVKEEVLRGVTVAEAIERAIESELSSIMDNVGVGSSVAHVGSSESGRSRESDEHLELVARINELKAENLYLQRRLADVERRARYALLEAERIRREAKAEAYKDLEVRKLREMVEKLNSKVRSLEERIAFLEEEAEKARNLLLAVGRGRLVLARLLPVLSSRALKRSIESMGPLQENEVVVVRDGVVPDHDVLQSLESSGILGVIVLGGDPERLVSHGIPAVAGSLGDCLIIWRGLAFICDSIIEELVEVRERIEAERESWVNIERIIEEYRRSREVSRAKRA